MRILNLTQHVVTPAQSEAGVFEPQSKSDCCALLNFDELPTADEVAERAERLAQVAADHGVGHAMIGGAPYLMASLEEALRRRYIVPLYAFTRREVVEVTAPDGTAQKTSLFRHAGFVTSPRLSGDRADSGERPADPNLPP